MRPQRGRVARVLSCGLDRAICRRVEIGERPVCPRISPRSKAWARARLNDYESGTDEYRLLQHRIAALEPSEGARSLSCGSVERLKIAPDRDQRWANRFSRVRW